MNIIDELGNPYQYEHQIDRLQKKYLQRNRLYELEQEGVPLASICLDKKKVARLLAKEVRTGKYDLPPAKIRWQRINSKDRQLYVYRITDLIVHSVLSSIINEALQPLFSSQLFSYRKGSQWVHAITELAKYIREYRHQNADIKSRGLYVVRRDVRKYTDSIPVHDKSDVWSMLHNLLAFNSTKNTHYWELIKHIVRPEIYSEEGLLFQNVKGVPTGSPISTTLFNLYLMDMDSELDKVPGAFYVRYSDDFLFVHPDPNEAQRISDRIDKILIAKELSANRDKTGDIYFNTPGKAPPIKGNYYGASEISFLGCNISFDGGISLTKEKLRHFLKDVTSCVRRTYNALDNKHIERAGPIICSVLNNALDSESPFKLNSTLQLRKIVTNRNQLKDLDYKIARIIVRTLTGDQTVRGFRKVKYSTIRKEWNLISLVHSRNCPS